MATTNPTDPALYETRTINGRTLLRCKDCGRESLFDAREVKHSPRCDLAPRRAVTVATTAQAPALRRGRPERLRSGEWGARVDGSPTVGEQVQITTRGGKTWTARVVEVLEVGEATSLVRTSTGVDAAVRAGEIAVSDEDVRATFERGSLTMSAAMNRDF